MVYYTRTDLVAFVLIATSLIFNGTSTFCNDWWADRTGERYGLFRVVTCEDNTCHFGAETVVWISVVRVLALVQFISLITSLTVHLLNMCEILNRAMLRFLTIVVLGLSCIFSHFETFVLASIYRQLVDESYARLSLPTNYAYFLTLPIGLNAISGTITIGPLLALAVVHTKEKKHNQESAPKSTSSKKEETTNL